MNFTIVYCYYILYYLHLQGYGSLRISFAATQDGLLGSN